jgi:hypothetical protein
MGSTADAAFGGKEKLFRKAIDRYRRAGGLRA